MDYFNIARSSVVTMPCEHSVSLEWMSNVINILGYLKP